jgi:HEAT repeat protein
VKGRALICIVVVLAFLACDDNETDRVGQLISKLEHADRDIRSDALEQLRGAIKVPRLTHEERRASLSGPMVIGPRQLDPLQLRTAEAVDRLVARERDRAIRMEAVELLRSLRPPGRRPGLLECALHGDQYVAGSCVEALLVVADPANLPQLVDLLRRSDMLLDPRQPDDPGRRQLVGLLPRTGSHLVPYLERLVDDADANAIASMLAPLASIGTDDACALVARVALDRRVATAQRRTALYLLGPSGTDAPPGSSCDRVHQYREQLEDLREDPELSVRCKAGCLLGERLVGCEHQCSPSPPGDSLEPTKSTPG